MESFYEKLRHMRIPEDAQEPESNPSGNETETDDTRAEPVFDLIEDTRSGPVDRFDCPYCYNVYYTEEHLISHKRTHHSSKQYTCKWCNIVFTYAGWSYHHKKHTNDKSYSCTSCNKSFFMLQQLKSHLANHKHSCNFCSDTFVTAQQLRAHANSVHDASVKGEVLHRRQKRSKLNRNSKLKDEILHRRRKRSKPNRNSKPTVIQPETPRNETIQHELPEINHSQRRIDVTKSFVHRDETIRHNLPHHQVAKQKKDRNGTTKSFDCDKCHQKFPKLNQFRDHLKKSFKCRPYWCNDCNAKFIQKKMLEKHVRSHLYKCSSCSQNFSCTNLLDVHIFNEHMQSVNDTSFAPKTGFRCRYCGLMYSTEEDLQNHIKFSGENLIICATCFYISETEDEFSYHLETAHGIFEERRSLYQFVD
ncbi:zinc finger protein 26-like [Planococcus citri]|uniref:zinc finger protein 26-like n=1 Tax=Planococcus citri TaxID=170843 RepID=UPI0031F95B44